MRKVSLPVPMAAFLGFCAAWMLAAMPARGQIITPKPEALRSGFAGTIAETFSPQPASALSPSTSSSREQGPAGASIRAQENYSPITVAGRLKWFAWRTAGPESLATGIFAPAIGTAENSPREYGPHWNGFAKRYGIRMSGVATSNAMEAGIGAAWGEDPRYQRAADKSFGGRVKNILVMAFAMRRRDGQLAPAYARYLAYAGSNFLSNTWRASSEATSGKAGERIGYAFLGSIGGNAFAEFWPGVKKFVFRRGR